MLSLRYLAALGFLLLSSCAIERRRVELPASLVTTDKDAWLNITGYGVMYCKANNDPAGANPVCMEPVLLAPAAPH